VCHESQVRRPYGTVSKGFDACAWSVVMADARLPRIQQLDPLTSRLSLPISTLADFRLQFHSILLIFASCPPPPCPRLSPSPHAIKKRAGPIRLVLLCPTRLLLACQRASELLCRHSKALVILSEYPLHLYSHAPMVTGTLSLAGLSSKGHQYTIHALWHP
jgi:hypothetical protein